MRRFLAELRRRHVLRVGAVYLVVAWAMIEVSATTFPMMSLPDWAPTLVFALLATALPVVLTLTWFYDVTPHGIVRTRGSARAEAAARRLEETAGQAHAQRQAQGDDTRSLAVLAFADLSRERDQDYLADGIAEEILNVLASLEDLRVAARTSSFAFKGRNVDVREIGRQLGVDLVLEGSVRTAGNRLRVTAQLVDVRDGMHLWSRRFDRDMSDVFAVQDEIAAEIASALGVSQPASVIARSATQRLEAYEAYLRGRQQFHRKTARSLAAARSLFENAIALDPSYAPAWAGIADTCSLLYMYWAPTEENRRCADECSLAALEHGPDHAEAHVSRGLALSLYERTAEAAAEFELARELNPRLYEAWYFSARLRFGAGDMKGAADDFLHAVEIQPEQYDAWGLLSQMLGATGRPEKARAAILRSKEAAERALLIDPDDVRALYFVAGSHIMLGDSARGIELLHRAAALDPEDSAVHYNIACGYANAGRIEQALHHLERAVALGYGHRKWIANDPDLAPLRSDPRYQKVLDNLQTARLSA